MVWEIEKKCLEIIPMSLKFISIACDKVGHHPSSKNNFHIKNALHKMEF